MIINQKNHPPTVRAWAMFDWANSAYNLVITSTIFPAYYTIITYTEENKDQVDFFGIKVINTALSNFSLSFAYLLMALALPLLSAVADVKGNRKAFMKGFTYLGAFACMGLFFFKLETLEWGIICSTLAAMGYVGGILFNNSYLPQIASTDQQNRISAQGFAYGYIGSVILQLICFAFVLRPDWFGIEDASLPARLSFLLVGVWWILFAQIPFKQLPDDVKTGKSVNRKVIKKAFVELKEVYSRLKNIPAIRRFLPAFFFYAMGVQTVMIVAAAFGEKVLQLGASKLIATILIIQLVAIGGAYLMSLLGRLIGNMKVLALVVAIWILICISAFYLQTETQFYLLAAVVGLVMGGIQSLSRSTYSQMIPVGEADMASFFSFYDVTEKVAIVIGLFAFALIEQLTNNIRYSALSLSIYFIVALVLLLKSQGLSRKPRPSA
jgi:UMF1 family MFS transporter